MKKFTWQIYISIVSEKKNNGGKEMTMNIEFSYTPIYNSGNNDLVDYNNKKGRRFTDWADDFGMMYPIGDEIPFKLSYKANENGNIGSVNLPIANRPG